jgi:hypothetical protein
MGRRSIALALACIATATAMASTAAADDPIPADPPPFPAQHVEVAPPPPAVVVPPVWYGWQILLVDIASDVAFVEAIRLGNGATAPLAGLGVAGYFAGGPIIHAAHGQSGNVGRSVAIRLLVPLGGFALGAVVGTAACGGGGDCGLAAAVFGILGGMGGMLVAQLVDATTVAFEPGTPDPPAASAQKPLVLVAPQIGMVRDSERRSVPTFGAVVSF